MNSPIQQFFSFNYKVGDAAQNRTGGAPAVEDEVEAFPTFDYKVFPRAKGQLWLRLENLADKYDLINHFEVTGSAEVRRMDLEVLALNLYQRANPGAAPPLMDI